MENDRELKMASATTTESPSPIAEPPKGRRHFIRWGRWGLLAAIAILGFAPWLTRIAVFRRAIYGQITAAIQGKLDSDNMHTGWTREIELRNLSLKTPDGMPVLRVPEFVSESRLWELILRPRQLGTWHAKSPTLDLYVDPQGSNVSQAFQLKPGAQPGALRRFLQVRNGRLVIEQGKLRFQYPGSLSNWELGDLNSTIETIPASQDRPAMWAVASGLLIDHVQVTPQITNDLLKFFAPVLANSTQVRGEFSLENHLLEVPWDNLSGMKGEGTLSLHRVEVGAGPIISQIALVLGVDASQLVVDECAVPYRISDQRVEHRGLEMQLGRMRVFSQGTVGLNEQIDLRVTIKFPDKPVREGPLAQRLAGKEVYLPVTGTLRKPDLDLAAVLRENQGNWPLIEGLAVGSQEIAEIVRTWREAREGAAEGEEPFRILPGPLGDRIRARLESWQSEEE